MGATFFSLPRKKSFNAKATLSLLKKQFTAIFFALTVICFILIVTLEAAGYLTIAITATGSMQKNISSGSLVVFAKTRTYDVGDVIAFKIYNSLVMHRIANVVDKGFKTKGDENVMTDPWVVPENAVKGKLLFSVPFLGFLISVMRAPIVFAGVSTILFIELTRGRFFREAETTDNKPHSNA